MDTALDELDFFAPLLEARASLQGGKGAGLVKLQCAGVRVPPFLCLSARAHEEFLRQNKSESFMRRLRGELEKNLKKAQLDKEFLAVRSSAIQEDSGEKSFAGLFKTELNCRGVDSVFSAILKVWESSQSPQVNSYRTQGQTIAMGVVLQRMMDFSHSGVLFTHSPLNAQEVLIESVWGLGDLLVSGEIQADQAMLPRSRSAKKAVRLQKGDQTEMLRPCSEGGTERIPLVPGQREKFSISSAEINELRTIALKLESQFGYPLDIEWGYEAGKLYFVQARPITHAAATVTVWDNSNIIESYAGITLPLTSSHVQTAYAQVYREFCRVMGVPKKVIARENEMFATMLGSIRGRIYYHLKHWYQMLSMFPLFESNQEFMEQMMGVRKTLKMEDQALFDFPEQRTPAWRKVLLFLKSVGQMVAAKKKSTEFLEFIDSIYRPLEVAHPPELDWSPAELFGLYLRLNDQVLGRWQAPIIVDTSCMISFGVLKKLLKKWTSLDADIVVNDLMCGQGNVFSAEPTQVLLRLSQSLRKHHSHWVVELLQEESPDAAQSELLMGLKDYVRFPECAKQWHDFLDRFGYRCVDELKFESVDLKEDPRFALTAVLGYLRQTDQGRSQELHLEEAKIRAQAEAVVFSSLSGLRNWIMKKSLEWARFSIITRERLRFERTRTFGVTRRIFRTLAKNLCASGVIDAEKEFYYATVTQWQEYFANESTGREVIRRYIKEAISEFSVFAQESPPPDRLLMRKDPKICAKEKSWETLDATFAQKEGEYRGFCCCSGSVSAPLRVAPTIVEAMAVNQEILVTERTDPGWVPLFPNCAGIVIERGSLLSHSAVIARELGVPTIVGVQGKPTSILRSGANGKLNASEGVLYVSP